MYILFHCREKSKDEKGQEVVGSYDFQQHHLSKLIFVFYFVAIYVYIREYSNSAYIGLTRYLKWQTEGGKGRGKNQFLCLS